MTHLYSIAMFLDLEIQSQDIYSLVLQGIVESKTVCTSLIQRLGNILWSAALEWKANS